MAEQMEEQMMKPWVARATSSAIVLVLMSGCTTTKQPALSINQDVAMTQFENVMVQSPPLIDSHWTRAEQDDFMRRIGHADAAAIGTIDVVTRISYYKSKGRIGLLFRPVELLHGQLPQKTLPLSLSAGQVGFDVSFLIEEVPKKILYLLLLKRTTSKPFRWVLYRPDELLIQQVRGMYDALARQRRS